jgi:hypothetical protein
MLHADSWSIGAFVLAAFATWRCTTLLLYESGPLGVFTRLRRMMVRAGLDRVVTCFDCASIWVSALVVAVIYPPAPHWLALIPATAGAARLLELRAGLADPSHDESPNDGE